MRNDVRALFLSHPGHSPQAFDATGRGTWLADLYALARQRLQTLGIRSVWGGQYCTASDPERFHSWRRDGTAAGRMVTAVWLKPASKSSALEA